MKAKQATGASSKVVTREKVEQDHASVQRKAWQIALPRRILARQEGKDGLCENFGQPIGKRHHAAGNLDHGRAMPPLFVRAANRMLPTDAAVRLHEPLDQAFGIINRAIQKRVALVRDTDLAVIFPECLARQLNTTKAFRLLTLPFDLPPVQIMLHTHSRFASDVGINWLRDTLVTMLAKAG